MLLAGIALHHVPGGDAARDARHQRGLYPGVIVWNNDESNGGDAIFLDRGRVAFDSVRPTDKVRYSTGTASEHLCDFASLSFANLGDKLATDNGVWARAGDLNGTGPEPDLAGGLARALDEIARDLRSCEYAMPQPPVG